MQGEAEAMPLGGLSIFDQFPSRSWLGFLHGSAMESPQLCSCNTYGPSLLPYRLCFDVWCCRKLRPEYLFEKGNGLRLRFLSLNV
jgi:hypothetical protein